MTGRRVRDALWLAVLVGMGLGAALVLAVLGWAAYGPAGAFAAVLLLGSVAAVTVLLTDQVRPVPAAPVLIIPAQRTGVPA